MTTDTYIDMRNLISPVGKRSGCPVRDCATPLKRVSSPWGQMPYCPHHCIRIHERTRTFVYYNGSDAVSRREAALRNILFERDYFRTHILGNAAKAETHRICHETSEDALTWNVFSRLARGHMLAGLLSTLTGLTVKEEPQLYLWGLGVRLHDSASPTLFPPLESARQTFEEGIKKFKTEPDIMLYVPGQLLVLVEAKFTSGNTIASTDETQDCPGEKPKSRDGILRRYTPAALPLGTSLASAAADPFYSQLYRNLVFAISMANQLGVRWGLVNLACEGQFHQQQQKVEFQDPTSSIRGLLPRESRSQFLFYSWERLYADHVAKATELKELAEYLYHKSAHCVRAMRLDGGPVSRGENGGVATGNVN